jgi:soluble P-type ATPase
MISIEIPNKSSFTAEHLVLDYNGTLAVDGVLYNGLSEQLNNLAKYIRIHVITADTFGKVRENLKSTDCEISILRTDNQAWQKLEFINNLGKNKVIAIGNGENDSLMLKAAALGIVLIQEEGASVKTLLNADIVCKSIHHALDLLLNPQRIAATLRI